MIEALSVCLGGRRSEGFFFGLAFNPNLGAQRFCGIGAVSSPALALRDADCGQNGGAGDGEAEEQKAEGHGRAGSFCCGPQVTAGVALKAS